MAASRAAATRKGISRAPAAGVKVKALSATSGVKFQLLSMASNWG